MQGSGAVIPLCTGIFLRIVTFRGLVCDDIGNMYGNVNFALAHIFDLSKYGLTTPALI